MLEKIKAAGTFNLLSLLAILYISMGMPLVHPLMHAHTEHDPSVSGDNGRLLQYQTEYDETHRCLICDFQATNQLHAADCCAAFSGHQSIDELVTSAPSFALHSALQHFDARAPPPLSAKA